ncbi:hypothetical protein [Metaplanococcus flavidus]|uniref:Lipoprotein n=1 Tax=Metaplanococcus flavidus TaxID=569883 RepID=A0ABW3LFR9_9BACL
MKKLSAPVTLFIALSLMAACQEDRNSAVTGNEIHLSDVYPSSFDEVKEIEIVDGTSGDSTLISATDEIKSFLDQLEQVKWEEVRRDEEREGYLWMVKIKSGDEEIQITSYSMGDREFNHNPKFNDYASSYFQK